MSLDWTTVIWSTKATLASSRLMTMMFGRGASSVSVPVSVSNSVSDLVPGSGGVHEIKKERTIGMRTILYTGRSSQGGGFISILFYSSESGPRRRLTSPAWRNTVGTSSLSTL